MMRILFSMLLAALGVAASTPPPAPGPPTPAPSQLVLENKAVKLVLRAAPSWHVASITFPSNTFRIAPAVPLPLYQIEWYEGGAWHTLDSYQARAEGARRSGDSLILRFAHDERKLKVECRVWASGSGLHWDAAFRNGSFKEASPSGRPAIFRYPGLGVHASGGPLEAVLSVAEGIRIRDVFGRMREGEKREWDYPGLMSAQMTAWMNASGGAVLYAADSSGYYKRLRVIRYRDHIIPTFEHILIGIGKADFRLPYAMVLTPFAGGWHKGADAYRDWAERQPWCRVPLARRQLPPAVARPTFFLCTHIRRGVGEQSKDESQAIPGLGEDYRTALGLPITNLFFSWERHGPWVAPDYFPPYPSREAFLRMSGAIHSRGDKTMLFLSGLNVTLAKTPRLGAPAYRLAEARRDALKASAIVGRDFRVQTEGKAEEGVGQKWILCPTVPAARMQVLDGVSQALDLGVDVIQVDQVVGGGVPPCFQESHGHPLAGLDRMTRGFADILREAKSLANQRGAALSLETPGEFFIPYIDIVHAREYMQGYWPREGKGVEGVPLFSYLYHDYLLGYGGDAQFMPGAENLGMAVYNQAMNLVAGRYPAGALWMENPKLAGLAPELRQALVEIAAIWRSEAGEFLQLGQARRLPKAFPEHPLSYDYSGHRHRFDAPVFLDMAYRLGGREIALFINTTREDQVLDLRSFAGSRDLEAIWPPERAGKPLDPARPMTMGPYRIAILRRSINP